MNPHAEIKGREAFAEFSTWAVGLGILVVALFPLSIPILVLTAVALVPLLIPVLAIGLVAAILWVPVRLGRRAAARLRAWTATRRSARPVGPSTSETSSTTAW